MNTSRTRVHALMFSVTLRYSKPEFEYPHYKNIEQRYKSLVSTAVGKARMGHRQHTCPCNITLPATLRGGSLANARQASDSKPNHPRPALEFLTTWVTGCMMPLLLRGPSAVPVLQPIFSNMFLPLFSCPSSGANAPTTSPSL